MGMEMGARDWQRGLHLSAYQASLRRFHPVPIYDSRCERAVSVGLLFHTGREVLFLIPYSLCNSRGLRPERQDAGIPGAAAVFYGLLH